jgi:hypothetical protein
MGSDEDGGVRLRSGEIGLHVKAACLAGEVISVAEVDVGQFERFWLAAPEEGLVLPQLKPATLMHVGVMTLLEASSANYFSLLHGVYAFNYFLPSVALIAPEPACTNDQRHN